MLKHRAIKLQCSLEREIAASITASLLLCLPQEVDEVLLPDAGDGVSAVAAGGVGDGEEDEFGVGDLFGEAFGDA